MTPDLSKIQFRQATEKDREVFISLGFQLREAEGVPVQPEQVNYFRQRFSDFLETGFWKVYFALIDQEIVGFTTFRYIFDTGHRQTHACFVQHLFVAEKYRHMGIGATILEWMENFCRKDNIQEVELFVLVNNQPARQFYLKSGFSEEMIQMKKKL